MTNEINLPSCNILNIIIQTIGIVLSLYLYNFKWIWRVANCSYSNKGIRYNEGLKFFNNNLTDWRLKELTHRMSKLKIVGKNHMMLCILNIYINLRKLKLQSCLMWRWCYEILMILQLFFLPFFLFSVKVLLLISFITCFGKSFVKNLFFAENQ